MKTHIQAIKSYISHNPLKSLLILAFILRLIAAIFSQGYGMHDDHFIVIEEPWSWTQGEDYDGWLPGTKGENAEPSIFSFFYPGLNFVAFKTMQFVGLSNPKGQMFIIRLMLALFSLLTVYYGYRIAEAYANQKVAQKVGLLLAIFWFMPFFSVRNLVEIIAIPPLLAGSWFLLKSYKPTKDDKTKWGLFLLAGIITGIAITIRFQSIIFIGGLGLVLLINKRFLPALIFALVTIGIFMG